MHAIYLKVLSGNHIGAEIPLNIGIYTIGNNESCDIILSDSCLQKHEFTLNITKDNKKEIIPLHGNTIQYKSQIQKKPFIIEDYSVFTSNTIHFAIGPIEISWPKIELPEPHKQTPITTTTKKDNDTEKKIETKTDGLSTNPSKTSSKKKQNLNSKKKLFFFCSIGILLFSFITVFLTLIIKNNNMAETQKNLTTQILIDKDKAYTVAKDMGLKYLMFNVNPQNNQLLINGYVDTLLTKQEFIKKLQDENIPHISNIIISNELKDNADKIIKNQGYDYIYTTIDNVPGSIILSGYISNEKELSELIKLLKENIYGLKSVISQIENQNNRFNQLKTILRKIKLISKIQIIKRNNQLDLLATQISENEIYELNNELNKFREKTNNQPKVLLQINNKNLQESIKPSKLILDIQGISFGQNPYIILNNGNKYTLGSDINGYILKEIKFEYLIFTKNNREIKYLLGDKK